MSEDEDVAVRSCSCTSWHMAACLVSLVSFGQPGNMDRVVFLLDTGAY